MCMLSQQPTQTVGRFRLRSDYFACETENFACEADFFRFFKKKKKKYFEQFTS